MKALTIWQPWATLVMIGAKPFEFRGWDYRKREPKLVNERIGIHAGAREPKIDEVEDILRRMDNGVSSLKDEIARPFVETVRQQLIALKAWRKEEGRKAAKRRRMLNENDVPEILRATEQPEFCCPLSAGLGTAIIGTPRNAAKLFGGTPTNDSYRIDHSMWAWPLSDIQPFAKPIPCSGAQGFWNWPSAEDMAAA